MSILNKEAYEVKRDELIYDSSRAPDAVNKVVSLPEGKGTFLRGQILDFDEKTGKYAVHQTGGTASAIVAVTTEYDAEESDTVVECYVNGTFRKAACISAEELTENDWNNLRNSGIVLK